MNSVEWISSWKSLNDRLKDDWFWIISNNRKKTAAFETKYESHVTLSE